jgi:hypothetical protein
MSSKNLRTFKEDDLTVIFKDGRTFERASSEEIATPVMSTAGDFCKKKEEIDKRKICHVHI